MVRALLAPEQSLRFQAKAIIAQLRSCSGMTFSFELDGHGWARVSLRSGEQSVTMTNVSYLTDALGDFLRAVTSLLTQGEATCAWADEPGTMWWQMSRLGRVAHIQVFALEADFMAGEVPRESYSASDGEVLFDGACDAIELCRVVAEAAEGLRPTYAASFERPFPENQLHLLRASIRAGIIA
jgi:hypothetical protein